jgi:hypothetical protein
MRLSGLFLTNKSLSRRGLSGCNWRIVSSRPKRRASAKNPLPPGFSRPSAYGMEAFPARSSLSFLVKSRRCNLSFDKPLAFVTGCQEVKEDLSRL